MGCVGDGVWATSVSGADNTDAGGADTSSSGSPPCWFSQCDCGIVCEGAVSAVWVDDSMGLLRVAKDPDDDCAVSKASADAARCADGT